MPDRLVWHALGLRLLGPTSTLQPVFPGQNVRLDFAGLLGAVENASPVAAADVLAERLTDALGASAVSFLVADFSGRALVRLGHAGSETAGRIQGRETAEHVPLAGSPHGRADRKSVV